MSGVELDYPDLMDTALRRVVGDVLEITRDLGAAPGEHHFYIEFMTGHAGVEIPDHLRQTYPDRMTIVLQHQFKDLEVTKDGFAVTLWFKGEAARLTVPFEAITVFADPAATFELRFSEPDPSDLSRITLQGKYDVCDDGGDDDDAPNAPPKAGPPADGPAEDKKRGEVVSLDAFRKK